MKGLVWLNKHACSKEMPAVREYKNRKLLTYTESWSFVDLQMVCFVFLYFTLYWRNKPSKFIPKFKTAFANFFTLIYSIPQNKSCILRRKRFILLVPDVIKATDHEGIVVSVVGVKIADADDDDVVDDVRIERRLRSAKCLDFVRFRNGFLQEVCSEERKVHFKA